MGIQTMPSKRKNGMLTNILGLYLLMVIKCSDKIKTKIKIKVIYNSSSTFK